MKTEELLQLISDNDIMVFGTGFVAEMFWYALKSHNLTGQVRGFMKTKAVPGEVFHGIPVYSRCRDVGLPICLAVHEAAAEEVAASLGSPMQARLTWIYPNIHELLFGSPLIYDQRVSLSELLEKQAPGDHWLDIRYLAIDAYLKTESVDRADDLYVRAMSIHSSRETAQKRLRLLKQLARSMAEGGYQTENAILIDSEWRIIDGLHRTSAAKALGIKEIPCNIVQATEAYDVLLTDKVRLTDGVLKNAGFVAGEIDLICRAGKQLREEGD